MDQYPVYQLCDAYDVIYTFILLLHIYILYILFYAKKINLLNLITTTPSKNYYYYPKIAPIGWFLITVAPLLAISSFVWTCITWPIVLVSLIVTIVIGGFILGLCAIIANIFGADYDSFSEFISDVNSEIIKIVSDYDDYSYSPKFNLKWIRILIVVSFLSIVSTLIYTNMDSKEISTNESHVIPEVEAEDNHTPKHLTLLSKYPNAFSAYDNGKDLKRMLDEMDSVQIRLDDLSDMTYHQANILINALYAEKGMIFTDKQLATFFKQCYWYKGKSQNTPKLRNKKKDNWRVVNRYLYKLN